MIGIENEALVASGGVISGHSKTGAGVDRRIYIGQIYDASSQYNYLNARYQNPSIGRFISEDPANVQGPLSAFLANPQMLNYYSYSLDNPITSKDPSGLFVLSSGLIQKGDTLSGIAGQINSAYGTSWTASELAFSSGISNVNLIYPGSYVRGYLPGSSYTSAPTGRTSTTNSSPGSSYISTPAQQSTSAVSIGSLSFPSLPSHFESHGADFGAQSPSEYSQMAEDFLTQSVKNGKSLYKYAPDQSTFRVYDPTTNSFGSYNTDTSGARTFFKPDPAEHGFDTNMEYWEAQDGAELSGEEAWELFLIFFPK